jgi:hypothetical protein
MTRLKPDVRMCGAAFATAPDRRFAHVDREDALCARSKALGKSPFATAELEHVLGPCFVDRIDRAPVFSKLVWARRASPWVDLVRVETLEIRARHEHWAEPEKDAAHEQSIEDRHRQRARTPRRGWTKSTSSRWTGARVRRRFRPRVHTKGS